MSLAVNTPKRRTPFVTGAIAILALIAAKIVFVYCCFAAASDAQGAVLFVLGGPIVLGALLAALFAARRLQRDIPVMGAVLKWISAAGLAFVVLFFVCAFARPLRPFPNAIIGVVARAYQSITGETPYMAAHRKQDMLSMMRNDLAQRQGRELDLAHLPTSRDWGHVCIFGPRTDNATASAVLGMKNWDIETYSKIATSEAISTLVFVAGRHVEYVVEVPNDEGSFAKLGKQCFPREKAVFLRTETAGQAPEFDVKK
ncbi:MAG: hypothetical protein ABI771_14755 [Betaproteobacteria bacterium]